MAKESIAFGPNLASGLEDTGGASPAAFNVVLEATGAVRRRPGIVAISEAPSTVVDENGIAALHVTEAGDLLAVGGPNLGKANIYRVVSGGALNLSPNTERQLLGTKRPSIAETEMLLVLAAGGPLQRVQLSDLQSARLSADAPDAAFVVANSLRLLANDETVSKTTVYYSGIAVGQVTYAGHEDWASADAGTFQAEARPDPVVALAESGNEVLVFGSKSLQVYGPDAVSRFVPVVGLDVGCLAPSSVVRADNRFWWLDNERRLVMSSGRSVEPVSEPAISNTLAKMGTVSDCFGFRVKLGDVDAVCWTFPTDGRTFVLQKNGGWAQWSGRALGNYSPFPALCTHNTNGRCLVGLEDGRIGEFSLTAHTDLGEPISAHATTGYLDRGSSSEKHCEAVKLTLRHQADEVGLAWLDYRDGPGEWTTLPVELDGTERTLSSVEFRGLGVYERRQWRIRFDGEAEVVLVSAQETFSVVR